jgi:hypothetical protein
MSEIIASPFNKPSCNAAHQSGGTLSQSHPRDSIGGIVDYQVVGTDPNYSGPIDGLAMITDYIPDAGHVNPDGTFLIVIETDAATYNVVLADGTQFTITAAQSTAYLGQWYPARLLRVLELGTTGSFSVGY